MKKILTLLHCLIVTSILSGQTTEPPPSTAVMTLGVFHFAYPNLDVVKTDEKDKISILDEPYQSEIRAISNAICDFKPTIIALEISPDEENETNTMYSLYKSNQYTLRKSESQQLGFRIGKQLNLPMVYCVNDWGRHYNGIESLFKDSVRMANFERYHSTTPDSIYKIQSSSRKVTSIIDELITLNDPEDIKERLSVYLLNPFKYEELPGDFTGVDFETGRWFNRNLRIFRNIQRIPHSSEDRILLIIGRDHLNLLNLFLDISKEFQLVSPIKYLEKAKSSMNQNN